MHFINDIESRDIELDLKYCERCGGLFLRELGTRLLYCPGCMAHLAGLLSATEVPDEARRRPRRKSRTPKPGGRAMQRATRIETLHGAALLEVRPC